LLARGCRFLGVRNNQYPVRLAAARRDATRELSLAQFVYTSFAQDVWGCEDTLYDPRTDHV